MTEISFPVRGAFLLSPRTANYIAALFREGDKFDYSRWLQAVKEEETQAKQGLATFISKDLVVPEIANNCKSEGARPNGRLITRAVPIPRMLRQARHVPKVRAPQIGTRRWLEKIRGAWDNFQSSRARDAVYGYLEAVFAIVKHYKVRRKIEKLLRHAFKFTDLRFGKKADPFATVIRCTSDDNADSKTIIKWARALRYAGRSKKPEVRLRTFMKEVGGVQASTRNGLYSESWWMLAGACRRTTDSDR
jgi:hypothetical protein